MISEGFLLKCYAETGNRKFLQRAKAIARSKRFSKDEKRFDGFKFAEKDSPLADFSYRQIAEGMKSEILASCNAQSQSQVWEIKIEKEKKEMGENNYSVEVKGKEMIIRIDLSQNLGRSQSGKNILVASSKGNQFIEKAGVTLGLNVYKKA